MCIHTSAGSIPDSYDIYRYLNLVRYSIFDTRYFRRKCNFVDIFRGYLKRLRHIHLLFFKKKIVMKHSGENEIPIFSRKSDFFSHKSEFVSKTYEILGVVLCYILLFENKRNPVFGHFPSFPDTMWCKAMVYTWFILCTP